MWRISVNCNRNRMTRYNPCCILRQMPFYKGWCYIDNNILCLPCGVRHFGKGRNQAHEQKPAIPLIGQNEIPLRHEIEFVMAL